MCKRYEGCLNVQDHTGTWKQPQFVPLVYTQRQSRLQHEEAHLKLHLSQNQVIHLVCFVLYAGANATSSTCQAAARGPVRASIWFKLSEGWTAFIRSYLLPSLVGVILSWNIPELQRLENTIQKPLDGCSHNGSIISFMHFYCKAPLMAQWKPIIGCLIAWNREKIQPEMLVNSVILKWVSFTPINVIRIKWKVKKVMRKFCHFSAGTRCLPAL